MTFADYMRAVAKQLEEAYARQDFEEYRRLLGCLNETMRDHAKKAGCEWASQ